MNFYKILHYGLRANRKKQKFRARACRIILKICFQCDIALEADISEDVYFCHHGFGIVVNPRVKMGGVHVYSIA